jgi:hypothetical protein
MREEKYTSGTFCKSILCAHHHALESLEGDAYLKMKERYCRDCKAWLFYLWLKKYDWKIVRTSPEMTIEEIAARIHGIDPEKADEIPIEELLSL